MYHFLMFIHLATIVPCIPLGLYLLLAKKGNALHRKLGFFYMVSMTITAIVSLFMSAKVGPQLFNHFGFIHLFSVLTLYSIPTALVAIKKGNIKKHQYKMIFLYIGAIGIAGAFTLTPGRYLYQLFFT